MLDNLRDSLKSLFDNPSPNVFNVSDPMQAYKEGYFYIELADEKVFMHGKLIVSMIDEDDENFIKGLENYLKAEGERRMLGRKYINALNQTMSKHITPFLHEPYFDVEGDGEVSWNVLFKKDITKDIEACNKNRDLIMLISDVVERTNFALNYKDNQRYYVGTRSNMMKEAQEILRVEKQQEALKNGENPIPTPKAEAPAAPAKPKEPTLKLKIFQNSDRTALENEFNEWFSENPSIDLNGLECKTCSNNNILENSVFVLYK